MDYMKLQSFLTKEFHFYRSIPYKMDDWYSKGADTYRRRTIRDIAKNVNRSKEIYFWGKLLLLERSHWLTCLLSLVSGPLLL
jgi:hypothetical protein